jgi:hypothetical protein
MQVVHQRVIPGARIGAIPAGADVSREIELIFPFMRNQFAMLRQWTIHQRTEDRQHGDGAANAANPEANDYSFLCDSYVAAYLNEDCSLKHMVENVIQSQRKAVLSSIQSCDQQHSAFVDQPSELHVLQSAENHDWVKSSRNTT